MDAKSWESIDISIFSESSATEIVLVKSQANLMIESIVWIVDETTTPSYNYECKYFLLLSFK